MTTTVAAPSSLTMASIHDFADRIAAVQGNGAQALTLALTGIAAPDLSLLQLVESARAHARTGGGSVTLSTPADAALAAVLDRAGFMGAMTPQDIDFWFHGELPQ